MFQTILSHILWKIKVMFQTTNQTIILQPLIPLAGSSHESLAWLATGVVTHLPIGSMVLVYMLKNWGILMVNVSIYSIHGSYMGYLNLNEVTNEPLTTPRTTPDPPGTTPQGPQPAASNADIPQFILLEKLGTIVNLA